MVVTYAESIFTFGISFVERYTTNALRYYLAWSVSNHPHFARLAMSMRNISNSCRFPSESHKQKNWWLCTEGTQTQINRNIINMYVCIIHIYESDGRRFVLERKLQETRERSISHVISPTFGDLTRGNM